jgi:MarR family transcriptional regulator, lower aerobic nicotinate degradation pathway regulator
VERSRLPRVPGLVVAEPAEDYRLDDQIGFLLRRANQRHIAIFAELMAEIGLTPTQFSALVKIRDEGCVSQNRLGRLTGMDPATILGVVQRLAARDLIEREIDPDDLRYARLTLTKAGRALLDRAVPRAADITAQTLAPLTPRERRLAVELLRKLT